MKVITTQKNIFGKGETWGFQNIASGVRDKRIKNYLFRRN
jgi:hypothetical protein